jgi:hypothetical protein
MACHTVRQSMCHTDVLADLRVLIPADYDNENKILLSPTVFTPFQYGIFMLPITAVRRLLSFLHSLDVHG